MTKTLGDYFSDWESEIFGFGYGTGEEHTIPALRRLMELMPAATAYNYKELEVELGGAVAWFLINALGHADAIEYGSSPRYAWPTPKGQRLRAFILSKTNEELIELANRDEHYIHCHRDACNCGPSGYEKGRVCQNPFFLDNPKPAIPEVQLKSARSKR